MKQTILLTFCVLVFAFPTSAYVVSGVAQDSQTGDPLPGIEIDLSLQQGNVLFTNTDDNGAFTFNNVPNGSHDLLFHYYEPVIIDSVYYLYTDYGTVVVNDADVTGIVFNIDPHYPIYHVSGTLYDAGTMQPITNQTISLRLDFAAHSGFFFAWSDSTGNYSFQDLVPDWTYDFNAFANDYYYGADTTLVIDPSDSTEINIDFYLQPKDGVTVTGQLYDIETNEPIEIANRTIRITAIDSYWAETDENGEFTFVNVEPGYYANITVTTEDTSYYNCDESTIYDLIVPDSGLSGVQLFQQEFVTVHEVTVDDSTFVPGDTKTLRFSLVNSDTRYGAIWGVELYLPDYITVVNTNPFYDYNTGEIIFQLVDDCGTTQHLVWEGYHTVYGSGNVGNLQSLNDSVYTDLEIQFSTDSVPDMPINYHVFYNYACTGGYFSYGTIMFYNEALLLRIGDYANADDQMIVYPNPADREAVVSITLDKNMNGELKLYDLTGKQVSQPGNATFFHKGANEIRFDTYNLNPGIYVCVFNAGGKTFTRKIVVSR